jgi:subtilisin family serine protease
MITKPHLRIWIAMALAALLAPPGVRATWQAKVDATLLQQAAAGETEMIVVLREQADLSGAAALTGKEAKGTHVVERKTAVAAATQPAVVAALAELGAASRSFWIVNALVARGDLAAVQVLAERDDVAQLLASSRGMLDLPGGAESAALTTAAGSNLVRVQADQVWELGYTGQGVVVASADTGVEWTHPALREKYRGWDGGSATHDYNWHDAIPNPNTECPGSSSEPCDDDALLGGGHGTHTVGTMVGDDGAGNQIGMAPGAQWIACRNMEYGLGAVPTYLECMQWFLAPTDGAGENPDPGMAPHVINNSWACVEVCPPTILRETTAALRAAGIVYVAAAGNDGDACNTIAFPPAIYPESLTVGATNIATDTIAGFSSRGSVLTLDPLSPHRKPDVTAPGQGVRSSLKGARYGSLSGTSMAAPHVAGLVALVLSANPSLVGDVDAVEGIIESSAVPKTTSQGCGGDAPDQVPNNVYGWGRIDALAAVQAALDRCAVIEDTAPAMEYKGGWGVIEEAAASGGIYHRRMGSKNGTGATPVARLTFAGGAVTYHFARSQAGGTADVFLDGTWRETLSYQSTDTAPVFGHSVRYDDLGEGTHALEIVHRTGAVYVDGFAVCGVPDAGAATAHSETTTTTATMGDGPLVVRQVAVGPDDEEVGVVVEGGAAPVTVRLLDTTGDLIASGGGLVAGLTASGLDAVPSVIGTYRVEVANPTLAPLRIAITRTVRNR